ncbi:hypothetical protein ID866_6741, partial [Astraeus odoratus]
QYSCEAQEDEHGQIIPRCFPIPRLFKLLSMSEPSSSGNNQNCKNHHPDRGNRGTR